jgi:uridine kinase
MIGDKLIVKREHTVAASRIAEILIPRIKNSQKKFIISIAGESGAGKSEIAFSLSRQLKKKGYPNVVLQQDDYFVYPPKTNAEMRKKNIRHVGPSEVHLSLIEQNLTDILGGKKQITKPLVVYDEDRISSETISLEGISVVIVEGTYTTLLKPVNCHVFIDRDLYDTLEARAQRAREVQDVYLEKILEIEHRIISRHRRYSDLIITRDYGVKENG